jgi:hypothetical protein
VGSKTAEGRLTSTGPVIEVSLKIKEMNICSEEMFRASTSALWSSFDSVAVHLATGPSNINVIVSCSVGDSVGSNVGDLLPDVGSTVDSNDGASVGTSVESYDGYNVGTSVEAYEGHTVGTNVGSWLGYSVPAQYLLDGYRVGLSVFKSSFALGQSVGALGVGITDGTRDGLSVGESVLYAEGFKLGWSVGYCVGNDVGVSVADFG